MSERWRKAVEESADALGERLLEQAEGRAEYTYEKIAAAVLESGLRTLLADGADERRIEAAAAAIHARLHQPDAAPWEQLDAMDKDFWLQIARAGLAASDRVMLESGDP